MVVVMVGNETALISSVRSQNAAVTEYLGFSFLFNSELQPMRGLGTFRVSVPILTK